MDSHRPDARTTVSPNHPRVLGVPVPARAFGLAPGWCRAALDAEVDASASAPTRWAAVAVASPTNRPIVTDGVVVDEVAPDARRKRTHREAGTTRPATWSMYRSHRTEPEVAAA